MGLMVMMMINMMMMMMMRVGLPLVRLHEAWSTIDPSIVGIDWTEIRKMMVKYICG